MLVDMDLRKRLEPEVQAHLDDPTQCAGLRALGPKHRTLQLIGFILLSIAISVKRIADRLTPRE